MSHFLTLVFTKKDGKTAEELLAPFDEHIEYAPYVKYTKEQAVAEIRKANEEYKNGLYAEYLANPKEYEENCNNKCHIAYLKNVFPKRLNWTDDECYAEMKKYFSDDMIRPNGDLLSTYNPKAKWDYYCIGGRWHKCLKTFNGEQVNTAYVKEVDWMDSVPFAVITPDGEWLERGFTSLNSSVSNEELINDWETKFHTLISHFDDDTRVTVVDCHM